MRKTNGLLMNRILCSILMMGLCLHSLAQGMGVEMDEQCRKWYGLAMSDTRSQRCLQYADSIESRGQQRGLRLAQFRAELIRLYHYAHYDDFDKLHRAAEAVRRTALAEGERRTYFFSYDKEVSALLQSGRTVEALRSAREMASKIQPGESAYAKYITMRALGKVYYYRRDYRRAEEVLDSAMVFVPEACRERKGLKTADTRVMLADSRFHMRKMEQTTSGFEDGIRAAADLTDSIDTYLQYAQMLNAQGDEARFRKTFSLLEPLVAKRKLNDKQQATFDLLRTYNALYDNDFDAAMQASKHINDEERRLRLLRNIYRRKGDYFKALDSERRLIALKDSLYLQFTNQDIDLLNEQLNNKDLRLLAERQANDLLQMKILQGQQRQRQAESRTKANELLADSERKQAREDSLRAETELNRSKMARIATDRKREQLARQTHETRYANTLMCIATFGLSCVVISVIFLWKRNRSTAKKLAHLADQLKRAHNEALRTNKIKTEFIQSMNYEVRAPLNEVLGFAQIIGAKNMTITEEERVEYVQHITESAMELNALIDRILEYHEGKS